MDCIKYLNSYENVQELVSIVRERRIFNNQMWEHYRGQGRPEYKLIPNIARGMSTPLELKQKETSLLGKLHEVFRANAEHNIIRTDPELSNDENLWNILIQAQHLSIPTRFLDWSLKWEVALWFAVENEKNDDVDGQFWVFSVPHNIHCTTDRDNYYKKDLDALDKTYFVNAPIYWSDELVKQVGEMKRLRQHGKFTVSSYSDCLIPLEEQENILPHLEKYCIPANSKKEIRLALKEKSFEEEFLYYQNEYPKIVDDMILEIKSV